MTQNTLKYMNTFRNLSELNPFIEKLNAFLRKLRERKTKRATVPMRDNYYKMESKNLIK